MPTVLLVRHGRTDANSAAILAGRTPGTRLDEMGRAQALSLAERLAGVVALSDTEAVAIAPAEESQGLAFAIRARRKNSREPG